MRAARRGSGWMTCDDQVERRRSAVQTRAAPDYRTTEGNTEPRVRCCRRSCHGRSRF
ncbi:hypothetical protein M9458_002485, partial [Cirrhinus mrigala]